MDGTNERRDARMRLAFGRGRVTLVDDSKTIQRLQIDTGPIGPDGASMGIRDDTARVVEYGHISVPPKDTDVVVIFVGGDPSNAVIIGTNHQQSRPTGYQPGDSGLYDIRGALITLTAAGPLIDAAGGNITIQNAKNINITATTGTVTVTAPHVTVVSNDVNLGATGGQPVARVGDTVNLTTGVITSGSSKVKAA